MSYSAPLLTQVDAFFIFLGVGFLLGWLYEVCVFLRLAFSDATRGFYVQDVGFCAAAFLTLFFSFLAFNDGVLRVVYLLAASVGFFAFRLTAGRLLRRVFARAAAALRQVAFRVLAPFERLSVRVRRACARILAAGKRLRERLCAARGKQKAAKTEKQSRKKEKKRQKQKK